MEEIKITYTAFGFDESSLTIEISEKMYENLDDAELEGEILDSDYISENKPKLHKKILRSIRKDMEECGLAPDDGYVEKKRSWGARYTEHSDASDHSLMDAMTEDDDIMYEIEL